MSYLCGFKTKLVYFYSFLYETQKVLLMSIVIPQAKSVYHGKVRDVYDLGDKLVLIASDRISAFDHILPHTIPYKGQVLNQIASYFLEATSHIVPNWWESSPDPCVSIGKKAIPIKLEMVVRGYLTGHAWRTYKSGERMLCGVTMPDGMVENQKFPTPIITPTTKADAGHDEDISADEILAKAVVSKADWEQLCAYSFALYEVGVEMALKRGLILVDTKYEFGYVDGQITLMDEIHTPDSSRYFYAEGYKESQAQSKPQKHLSKEFVREWLIANGFQGLEGQQVPEMTDMWVTEISDRYIQLYEKITGKIFVREPLDDVERRIIDNLKPFLI